jgi:hypothetical protein
MQAADDQVVVAVPAGDLGEPFRHRDALAFRAGGHVAVGQCVGRRGGLGWERRQLVGETERGRLGDGRGVPGNEAGEPFVPE